MCCHGYTLFYKHVPWQFTQSLIRQCLIALCFAPPTKVVAYPPPICNGRIGGKASDWWVLPLPSHPPSALVSTPTSDAIAIYDLISLLFAHCPAWTTVICDIRGMTLPLSQEMHAGRCSPKANPALFAMHNLGVESQVSHVPWSTSLSSLQVSDLIIPPSSPSFTPFPLSCIFPVQPHLLGVAMATTLELPSSHVWWHPSDMNLSWSYVDTRNGSWTQTSKLGVVFFVNKLCAFCPFQYIFAEKEQTIEFESLFWCCRGN